MKEQSVPVQEEKGKNVYTKSKHGCVREVRLWGGASGFDLSVGFL